RLQFHGIVPTAELVHDGCVASTLLSEPEAQIVLVSLPPPDLFGGVVAVAVDSTPIGSDVGSTPFDRRIVAHRDEQHATRREHAPALLECSQNVVARQQMRYSLSQARTAANGCGNTDDRR